MIYFDNAATTCLAPEVLDKMMPYLTAQYGNPSSFHQAGRAARKAVAAAREQVAQALNAASPECIVFTSGGSESNNWFLQMMSQSEKRHAMTTPIEHHAMLRRCESLAQSGWQMESLPVDRFGRVDLAAAGECFRKAEGALGFASVMTANNEIGTVQPIAELAALCHGAGGLFHTDAVQAAGHLPLDVQASDVDFLSLSAHKFHGPKGIGALYLKQPRSARPLISGGGQEFGLRAGTENVAGIVGLGEALALATARLCRDTEKVCAMRDALLRGAAAIPGVHVTGYEAAGDLSRRLPGNASFTVDGLTGESLVLALDLRGICVGNGSACAGGSIEPSHVLTAIGLKKEQAFGGLRLSLSAYNTMDEVEVVLEALRRVIPMLRGQ